MNKAVYYIQSIDTFEEQCVVIKVVSQSALLGDHMKTIVIDKSLSNISYFEHKSLNNLKRYINMQVSVITNKI